MILSKKVILFVCSAIFLLLGLMTAALGPVLPQLAANAGVSLAEIGTVFTGIFLGALAAQLVAGPLGDRIGQEKVIFGSLLLIAAGILGISLSRSLAVTLAFSLLTGLGHGGIDLGGNVLIAMVFNGQSVSALNVLNLFFGLGAFTGPTLVSLSLRWWQNGLPAMWLCAALLLLLAAWMFGMRGRPLTKGQMQPVASDSSPSMPIYRSPLLWALGLLILVYVGTENGMGGWTTTYLQRTTSTPIETAALVTAGFWLALTAGRMVSAWLGLRLASRSLLLISLIGAVAGGVLMVLGGGSLAATIAAVLVTGFSFGSIYPTVMAITTAQFQNQPGKAVSVVAALGSVGGALLPWVQGVALVKISPFAVAWFALGGAALMLALSFASGRIRD